MARPTTVDAAPVRRDASARRTGHRVDEAQTLALMWAAAALLAVPGTLHDLAPSHQPLALSLLGLAFAAAVALDLAARRWREQLPMAVIHVGVGLAPVCLAIATYFGRGTATGAAGVQLFAWVPLYAFLFLRWTQATAYAVWSSLVCVLAVHFSFTQSATTSSPTSTAILATGTSVIAGLIAAYVRTLFRRQSGTDGLTGLPNRRSLNWLVGQGVSDTRHRNLPLTVAIVDLDHFKEVNDRSGHLAGDQLLVSVTGRWRAVTAGRAGLLRYGGDEFVLVMPGVGMSGASALVDELRDAGGHPCSAGIARWRPDDTVASVVARADASLTMAKVRGRNRTACDGDDARRGTGDVSGERPRFRRWMEQLYTGVGAGDLPAATLAVVLGTIMLVAGALELPVVVFFPLPGVSKALPLTIVLVAMTYALGLIVVAHRLRARFPYWALHASMLGAVVLIALGTWSAQGEAVAIIGLNLYFWGVLYVFGFFRWQIGVCYLALSVVLGCAILSFTVIQDPVTVELIFATSAVVGAVVVGHERVALRRLAFVDVLTGLPNRAAFAGLLRRAVSTASERSAPLSVAVIDLDNLKAANDSLGHEAGDVILQRFVTEWDAMLRADDILVRYGGDEFIALLPGCDLADAERVLRRIHVLSEYECSIGVAQWRRVDTSEELLARADAALYRAKQQGRNQVVVG